MNNNNGGWFGCLVSAFFTAAQTEHTFQVISLILTCIATVITIAYTLYKWYKAAKQDGKIDVDELKELVDIVSDGAEKLKDNIESAKTEEGEK